MNDNYNSNPSNIILENRKKISVSGVNEVISFDDNSITLITKLGELEIKGNDIKIEKLNLDVSEVTATGDFYLLEYVNDDAKKSGGFISRLFK